MFHLQPSVQHQHIRAFAGRETSGLALQAPFGGVKKSSTDSYKEQGAGAVEFYSKLKTVYLDYSA